MKFNFWHIITMQKLATFLFQTVTSSDLWSFAFRNLCVRMIFWIHICLNLRCIQLHWITLIYWFLLLKWHLWYNKNSKVFLCNSKTNLQSLYPKLIEQQKIIVNEKFIAILWRNEEIIHSFGPFKFIQYVHLCHSQINYNFENNSKYSLIFYCFFVIKQSIEKII